MSSSQYSHSINVIYRYLSFSEIMLLIRKAIGYRYLLCSVDSLSYRWAYSVHTQSASPHSKDGTWAP